MHAWCVFERGIGGDPRAAVRIVSGVAGGDLCGLQRAASVGGVRRGRVRWVRLPRLERAAAAAPHRRPARRCRR